MSEIVLKQLKFSNAFSYGLHNSVQFNKNRITQLVGPNGVGKSSLVFLLQEVLFGKNTKGIKKNDILNRYIRSNYWNASLYFSVNDDNYIVNSKREKTTTKISIYKNNKDISEHKVLDNYKKIQQILGMDFETFSQLTYQSSTDLLDFIKATDTNRKKFLIKLFNLNKYLEIGEKIKVCLRQAEDEMNVQRGELAGVNKVLEKEFDHTKKELFEIPVIDEEKIRLRDEFKKAMDDWKENFNKIQKNNTYIQQRKELDFDYNMEYPEEPGNLYKDLNNAEDIISYKVKKKKELEDALSKLDTRESCEYCGSKLNNESKIELAKTLRNDIATLKNDIIDLHDIKRGLADRKHEYLKKLVAYNENQAKIKKFENLSQLIDITLPSHAGNYKDLDDELRKLNSYINLTRLGIERNIEYNNQIIEYNAKIDTLIQQRNEFSSRQRQINCDIVKLRSKIDRLAILKKAFSSTGIVAFKLENLSKQLEETINHYLSELSDGQFHLIFRLVGDKLNIVLYSNGKESDVVNASGGEFSRIQTAILLSIRKLLTSMGGNNINFLCLDEITGVLDAEGKEKLVEVLLEEGLNTFLISHDFNHPLIDKINIIKKNNISRIEGEVI